MTTTPTTPTKPAKPLNAFESLSQRLASGVRAAPAQAQGGARGKPLPRLGRTSAAARLLDRAGRPTVALQPRAYKGHGARITGRADSQAQAQRSAIIRSTNIGPVTPAPAPAPDTPVQIVSLGPPSARSTTAHASPSAPPASAPGAAISAPADLRAFVHAQPVADVARALRVSRATAHRLRSSYWPADDRRLLQAWDAYKGRQSERQSGWMLRRVDARGQVRHAGHLWSGTSLATRAGQTVAVARVGAARLLAQSLDLPAQRFELCALSPQEA